MKYRVIYLRQRRQYMFSPAGPRSFVCLSVCKITQKCVYAFRWNVACWQMSGHGRTDLTFEPDPDHSPVPGTGFTPDFWILTGYLKKLRTDFDEILCIDSCGGLHDLVRFWAECGSEFGSWNQITPHFWISAGYLKKLWTDFDEYLMGR